MRRTVLIYGLGAGLLLLGLRLLEFRYLVVEHALEIYGGVTALVFAGLGLWLGLRLTRPPVPVIVKEVPVPVPVRAEEPFAVDPRLLERLGMTAREHEILTLVAEGLSNREIAERLFVSENTVKTHVSRVMAKLDARRRTQAVQLAKAAGLLP